MEKDELIKTLILQRNKSMQRIFAHSVAIGIEKSNIQSIAKQIAELSECEDYSTAKEQDGGMIH